VLAKILISRYFSSKNIECNYLPKIMNGAGSGCHVHLSIWKDGKNILG
jgi:glutamine synthetase